MQPNHLLHSLNEGDPDGYCPGLGPAVCGWPINTGVGEHEGRLCTEYFDASGADGEPITHCPECGLCLSGVELLDEAPDLAPSWVPETLIADVTRWVRVPAIAAEEARDA